MSNTFSVAVRLSGIDFPLLRKQKEQLVELTHLTQLVKEDYDALTGVINFLDHFQDQCVEAGVPEDIVFGLVEN